MPRLFHDTTFCRDMPEVLATDYMVGLMELACTHGIVAYIDWAREQSVGAHVSFSRLAATPPGMTLTIKGEVIEVNGRRVKFRVEDWDDLDKITEDEHERTIIFPEQFNARLAQKIANIPA